MLNPEAKAISANKLDSLFESEEKRKLGVDIFDSAGRLATYLILTFFSSSHQYVYNREHYWPSREKEINDAGVFYLYTIPMLFEDGKQFYLLKVSEADPHNETKLVDFKQYIFDKQNKVVRSSDCDLIEEDSSVTCYQYDNNVLTGQNMHRYVKKGSRTDKLIQGGGLDTAVNVNYYYSKGLLDSCIRTSVYVNAKWQQERIYYDAKGIRSYERFKTSENSMGEIIKYKQIFRHR